MVNNGPEPESHVQVLPQNNRPVRYLLNQYMAISKLVTLHLELHYGQRDQVKTYGLIFVHMETEIL